MSNAEIVRYGDHPVSLLALPVPAHLGSESGDFEADAGYVQRVNAEPYHSFSTPIERPLVAAFKKRPGDEASASQDEILAFLGWPQYEERLLVVELSDGEQYAMPAVVEKVDLRSASTVIVQFATPAAFYEGLYRRTALTAVTGISTSPRSYPLTNEGQVWTPARMTVGWTAQHPTKDSTIGWQYLIETTVTNDGDKSMRNYAVYLPDLDSAALITATKMLANGDDVRVFYDGVEQPRSLRNWGSKKAHILCVIEELAAGESQTIQVVYGNASAGTPPALTDDAYRQTKRPAFDRNGDWGNTTAGSASLLTDSGKSWTVNRWRRGRVYIVGGTGAGQMREISSNTATTITPTSNFSPALDATSDYVIVMAENDFHTYLVMQVEHTETSRGGWFANKAQSRPSSISFQTPHAWKRNLLLKNGDDYNQVEITPINVGTVDYFPIFDADRRRANDRTLSEEGLYDGVAIYNPFGYTRMVFDGQLKNPEGICTFYVAGREAGGGGWEDIFEHSAVSSSLTAFSPQDITLTDTTHHIAFALIGLDGEEVDDEAKSTSTATGRWDEVLRLDIDDTNLGVSAWTSETAIYDMQATLRFGGGSGSLLTAATTGGTHALSYKVEAPYDLIEIGSDARLFLPTSNKIRIDGRDGRVHRLDSSGDAVETIPNRVRVDRRTFTPYGAEVTVLAPAWNEMHAPMAEPWTDPGFETSIAEWTESEPFPTYMTTVLTRDTTTVKSGTGSMRFTVTQLNPGAGAGRVYAFGPLIPVQPKQIVSFGCWAQATSVTNVVPLIGFRMCNSAGSGLTIYDDYLQPAPVVANEWRWVSFQWRIEDLFEGTTEIHFVRPFLGVHAINEAVSSPSVYFDDLVWMPSDVTIEENRIGTLTLEADYYPRRLT